MTTNTAERYAIDHAGYMADAAKGFQEACNALWNAMILADTEDAGDETHEELERAKVRYNERFGALKFAVYEFEKRRDRLAKTECLREGHENG